jgi:hypothetical protein
VYHRQSFCEINKPSDAKETSQAEPPAAHRIKLLST